MGRGLLAKLGEVGIVIGVITISVAIAHGEGGAVANNVEDGGRSGGQDHAHGPKEVDVQAHLTLAVAGGQLRALGKNDEQTRNAHEKHPQPTLRDVSSITRIPGNNAHLFYADPQKP